MHNSYFDHPHAPITRHDLDDYTLHNSSCISINDASSVRRKRPRVSSQHFTASRTPKLSTTHDLSASISSFDAHSPSPLANSDYFLSGGLDTPGTWSEHQIETAAEKDAELDFRPNRFMDRQVERAVLNPNLAMTTTPDSNSWHIGRTAWALTGGLAGKIFNFCWMTTFRGFQAGGGQAYTDYAQAVTKSSPHSNEHDTSKRRRKIPGSYPGSRLSLEAQSRDINRTPLSEDPFQLRERYTPSDKNPGNNWIMVEHTHRSRGEDTSPARKRSKASYAGAISRTEPSPVPTASRVHTASFASPRSRTSSTTAVLARPHSAAKRSRQSLASPASRRQSSLFATQQSPASPEIEQYQRKKRKEDRKQDESIRRLNAQLQDMIKEGQQALGSKIEVMGDDYDLDEGYFDDEIR